MTKMMRQQMTRIVFGCAALAVSVTAINAQTPPQRTSAPATTGSKLPAPQDAVAPPNYIIGSDDVLVVTVWGARDVSGEVIVRPDGKITLPVGNDIVASGLTTEELKSKVTDELKRFYEQPDIFIQVKQINSRRVFITGAVGKNGAYALTGPMTIVQLISMAGGLSEFADAKNIVVIRGAQTIKVNYEDLLKSKNVSKNNIELRPGDTVMVK